MVCRTFPGRTKGLKKPSESKRELTVERMPRLNGGLLVGTTLNMNVSESASQCSPSVQPIGLADQDLDSKQDLL